MRTRLAIVLALLGGCFGDEECIRKSDCVAELETPDAAIDAEAIDAPIDASPPVPDLPIDPPPDVMTP